MLRQSMFLVALGLLSLSAADALAVPVVTRMPTARTQRPLTMPSGAFDIQIAGEFATLGSDTPIGMVGAGMRYGITADTELTLALLRYRVRSIMGTEAERMRRFAFALAAPPVDHDIDSPMVGIVQRLIDGNFEFAARIDVELPLQSTVEVVVAFPMRLHLGPRLSFDAVVAARSDVTRIESTGGFGGARLTGQITDTLALFAVFEIDGDTDALVMRPGGGGAYTFAKRGHASADLALTMYYGVASERASNGAREIAGVPFSALLNLSLFFGEDASTDNDDFWN